MNDDWVKCVADKMSGLEKNSLQEEQKFNDYITDDLINMIQSNWKKENIDKFNKLPKAKKEEFVRNLIASLA